MAVVPCSAGCLARIAHGLSLDLVGRAADVMLKERRRLVLCLRETPVSLVHARAMVQAIEAGAFVMPASPSFYSKPTTIDELVDTVVSRILDRLGIPNGLMRRWEGLAPRARASTAGQTEPVEE
jgi:4-hydroxy-3-polyprenylbenzoate decarboxylase